MSSIMEKLQKNKMQYVGVRAGEKDIDDTIPVVEFTNMSQEVKNNCIKVCKEAIKTTPESNISYFKKLAKIIKLTLQTDVNETWNVIVGTDYGAFCSFEKTHIIYFRLNEIYFLLFRFGAEQRN